MIFDYFFSIIFIVFTLFLYKKYKYKIIFFVPVFSVFTEAVRGFLGEDSKILGFRNLLLSILFIFIATKIKLTNKFNVVITLIFFFVLIFFSSDSLVSLLNYQVFFNSLILLSLSYYLTKNFKDYYVFLSSLKYILVIMIISIIGYSVFKIGYNPYDINSDFSPGIFLQNRIYPAGFILIMVPVIYQFFYQKKNKMQINIIFALTGIILLLNMRRSAILIILFGLLFIFFHSRKKSKTVFALIGFMILLSMFLPFYINILEDQIYARLDVLEYSLDDMIEKERRLMEFPVIFDEIILSPKSITDFLFGKEVFNSVGNYAEGTWGARVLHVDFNIILHGAGIIGILLYFLIFLKLFLAFKKTKLQIKANISYNSIIAVFYGVFFSLLLITFSSGLFSFTYRSIVFIFLGSSLSVMENKLLDRKI